MVIEVTGTLSNLASASVIVRSFEVYVEVEGGAQRLVVAGSSTPLTLAPGGTEAWTVVVPARLQPSDAPTADARVTGWSWLDAGLSAACPV